MSIPPAEAEWGSSRAGGTASSRASTLTPSWERTLGRKGTMRRLQRVLEVPRPAEEVFRYLDDVRLAGAHMQRGEMGVRLQVEQLSANSEGEGATYRWHGKAYGLPVDYTVVVEKWIRNQERASRTIGSARLIVMSGFRMHFTLEPTGGGTRITIDFDYDLPTSLLGRLVSRLLGKRYGDWCLDMIMADALHALKAAPAAMTPAGLGS